MEITQHTLSKLRVVGADRLDPIDVYFDDMGKGEAHVTIICYGSSWTTYFGSMGKSAREFIKGCNASYLLNRFSNGADKKRSKQAELYLLRIIEAVLLALKGQPND